MQILDTNQVSIFNVAAIPSTNLKYLFLAFDDVIKIVNQILFDKHIKQCIWAGFESLCKFQVAIPTMQ